MHSRHRVSSSVAHLDLSLLRPCQCLLCSVREMHTVYPTVDLVDMSRRAASSMAQSVLCLPLMLSPSRSTRCFSCLCLCNLVIRLFRTVGCPVLSPQYSSPGISCPVMIDCEETVRVFGRIPPAAISSRSPSVILSAR